MKQYISLINHTQNIILIVSVCILMTLPTGLMFWPDTISPYTSLLYSLAHFSLFFVMSVRPLADIFPQIKWIRPLVILRKGVGVFSAAIIVSFILSKAAIDPAAYFSNLFTVQYWSISNLALFAHAADISAFLLLITSNRLSKRLMGIWWKRLQRLSYVYFYGSALYLLIVYGKLSMLFLILFITYITLLAYYINRQRRINLLKTQTI